MVYGKKIIFSYVVDSSSIDDVSKLADDDSIHLEDVFQLVIINNHNFIWLDWFNIVIKKTVRIANKAQ